MENIPSILFGVQAIEKKRESMYQLESTAMHRKLGAQAPLACKSRFISQEPRRPFGGLGDSAWLGAAVQTRHPRSAGSGRAGREPRSHRFQPQPGKAGRCSRVCSWQPGARAPRPHHPGAGMCALRATSVPPGARRGRRPAPSRPGGRGARAGWGRDPGRDPERSLGPAGRRRRAGCGGDHNLFRGNETVTVGPVDPFHRLAPAPSRSRRARANADSSPAYGNGQGRLGPGGARAHAGETFSKK